METRNVTGHKHRLNGIELQRKKITTHASPLRKTSELERSPDHDAPTDWLLFPGFHSYDRTLHRKNFVPHAPSPFHYTSQASNASFRNRFIRMSSRIPETLASRVSCQLPVELSSLHRLFSFLFSFFFFPITLLYPFFGRVIRMILDEF